MRVLWLGSKGTMAGKGETCVEQSGKAVKGRYNWIDGETRESPFWSQSSCSQN